MSITPDTTQIAIDALKITKDAVAVAAGDPAAAVALLPDVAALLEQLVVLLPPVDAPQLDPSDRAAIDAQAQHDLDAKFPPK